MTLITIILGLLYHMQNVKLLTPCSQDMVSVSYRLQAVRFDWSTLYSIKDSPRAIVFRYQSKWSCLKVNIGQLHFKHHTKQCTNEIEEHRENPKIGFFDAEWSSTRPTFPHPQTQSRPLCPSGRCTRCASQILYLWCKLAITSVDCTCILLQ